MIGNSSASARSRIINSHRASLDSSGWWWLQAVDWLIRRNRAWAYRWTRPRNRPSAASSSRNAATVIRRASPGSWQKIWVGLRSDPRRTGTPVIPSLPTTLTSLVWPFSRMMTDDSIPDLGK